ncbi:hypothetical protein [Rhizobium leucaenae]|uniref:hypothetical protein n=1 Tax=Rhizobium leucaenae TaxID=29450 RepID=UPI0007EE68DB|nr:hypothetical protein [Rhizobium leucaenae]
MKPLDLMKTYADLGDKHKLPTTPAGMKLQAALNEFMRDWSSDGDDQFEPLAEISLIFSRTFVAINMSFHQGCVCHKCIASAAMVLGQLIEEEADGLHARMERTAGMTH